MLALMITFWALFFIVSYIGIIFILIKGKQRNRFFGTLLSTIFPVVGSVPAYIMACKYEKRISSKSKKINNNIVKYILAGMQIASVLLMFAPFYKVESQGISLISLIIGSGSYGGVIKPAAFLIYILILSAVSVILNLCLKKSNISNFMTYFTSFVNVFSVLVYGFIVTSLENISSTPLVWIYAIFNVFIMALSYVSLIANRDSFLFKLEYSEKIEYVKEQKKKAEIKEKIVTKSEENKISVSNTYKCSKCGKMVTKGKLCSCISNKKPETINLPENTEKKKNSAFVSASCCKYCKKPLSVGEVCQCRSESDPKPITAEKKESRKCTYCGQVLVGDSTCVCEKIMKNSVPDKNKSDSKKLFESQSEKKEINVADELIELEKTINSKFEHIKEIFDSSKDK